MDPKITGEFISKLRKEKDMTQKELAEKLNVSDKAISKWETGRGYPDIESLMSLSGEFSVSINEILYGKRIETPVVAQEAEKDIASAYIITDKKKKNIKIIAIILAAVLIVVSVVSAFIMTTVTDLYKKVMGSPDCVIASDYSELTLFGERYVPIVLENADCKVSDELVREAQVKGSTFLDKLFFGDSVHSVEGCPNNDIVFLQTDYDDAVSDFFCREDKVDEYTRMYKEYPYDQMIAEILSADWDTVDVTISDNLKSMIESVDLSKAETVTCEWSRSDDDDEMISIISRQSEGFFRRDIGELILADGEYYWINYEHFYFEQTPDYESFKGCALDDSYDSELDELFSHMFE